MIKHIFRGSVIVTAAVTAFLLGHTAIYYETVFNEEVSMVLPASVYVSPNEDLRFSYADLFHTSSQFLDRGELQYHIDLLTDRIDLHGYVEVWNTDVSLSVFLEQAKNAFSPSVSDFKETFPTNDPNSRIWEYNVQDIHAKQYFSQQGQKLIVVALFVPLSLWSEKYDAMFLEIQQSVTLK